MADRYFNPFAAIDISVPKDFHEAFIQYSQREARAVIDQSPFPRMIDLWFMAVCVAARNGEKPVDLSNYATTKIIDGSIFGSDPWRVQTLMMVVLNYTGDVNILAEPRKMMVLANGLAMAGVPTVLDMLKQGGGDPIWNLSEAVEGLVSRSQS